MRQSHLQSCSHQGWFTGHTSGRCFLLKWGSSYVPNVCSNITSAALRQHYHCHHRGIHHTLHSLLEMGKQNNCSNQWCPISFWNLHPDCSRLEWSGVCAVLLDARVPFWHDHSRLSLKAALCSLYGVMLSSRGFLINLKCEGGNDVFPTVDHHRRRTRSRVGATCFWAQTWWDLCIVTQILYCSHCTPSLPRLPSGILFSSFSILLMYSNLGQINLIKLVLLLVSLLAWNPGHLISIQFSWHLANSGILWNPDTFNFLGVYNL